MQFNKGYIVSKTLIAENTYRIEFTPKDPIYPKSGQYISIEVAPSAFRMYSLSGKNDDRHEIILDTVHGGPGSKFFEQARTGENFSFLGPIGNFVLSGSRKSKLFISTGTGIGPFKCMIEDELLRSHDRHVLLIFGARDISRAILLDFFRFKKQSFPNFDFKYCLSREKDDEVFKNIEFFRGRVTDFLSQTFNDLPKDSEFYLCGNALMINDSTRILTDNGVGVEDIFLERW